MNVILTSAAVVFLFARAAFAYDTDGLQTPQPAPEGSPQNLALASKHFDEGVDLYRQRKYAEARIEFEASYALSKAPDLLHNLSQTAEKLGQIADAIQFEERFLATKRADLTQSEIDLSEGRLGRLRAKLAENLKASAPPAQAPPAQAPRAEGWRLVPRPALGLMLGGGAIVLGAIGCGAAALSDRNLLYSGVYPDEADALLDRNRVLNASAISFGVIGGVALAAGAGWAIAERLRQRPAPSLVSSGTRLVW